MNHLFLELQAREKLAKYRNEGMSSQALSGETINGAPRFLSLWQSLSRLRPSHRLSKQAVTELAERLS